MLLLISAALTAPARAMPVGGGDSYSYGDADCGYRSIFHVDPARATEDAAWGVFTKVAALLTGLCLGIFRAVRSSGAKVFMVFSWLLLCVALYSWYENARVYHAPVAEPEPALVGS
jgi:hypothetical protein